jgi:hypothetical protein
MSEIVQIEDLLVGTPLRVFEDQSGFCVRVNAKDLRRSSMAEISKGEPTAVSPECYHCRWNDNPVALGDVINAGDDILASYAYECGFRSAEVVRPPRRFVR